MHGGNYMQFGTAGVYNVFGAALVVKALGDWWSRVVAGPQIEKVFKGQVFNGFVSPVKEF